MPKKSYFTRSISRIPASSEDGAICHYGLQLKVMYYSIATRSSFLNVGSGSWLAFDYNAISQNSQLTQENSNQKYKNWNNLATKIIGIHENNALTTNDTEKYDLKTLKAIYSLILFYLLLVCVIRISLACIRMSLVCHLHLTLIFCQFLQIVFQGYPRHKMCHLRYRIRIFKKIFKIFKFLYFY